MGSSLSARTRPGEVEFERQLREVQPEVDRELADIFKQNNWIESCRRRGGSGGESTGLRSTIDGLRLAAYARALEVA